MRRDEQLYKVTEPKMYRHYQGGDEFFFIISGDVYDDIGFINRLAERTSSYKEQIQEEILEKIMDKTKSGAFRLSFSAAISPIHPRTDWETAFQNAYELLDRAKKDSSSHLLVVFDRIYQDPKAYQADTSKNWCG